MIPMPPGGAKKTTQANDGARSSTHRTAGGLKENFRAIGTPGGRPVSLLVACAAQRRRQRTIDCSQTHEVTTQLGG